MDRVQLPGSGGLLPATVPRDVQEPVFAVLDVLRPVYGLSRAGERDVPVIGMPLIAWAKELDDPDAVLGHQCPDPATIDRPDAASRHEVDGLSDFVPAVAGPICRIRRSDRIGDAGAERLAKQADHI